MSEEAEAGTCACVVCSAQVLIRAAEGQRCPRTGEALALLASHFSCCCRWRRAAEAAAEPASPAPVYEPVVISDHCLHVPVVVPGRLPAEVARLYEFLRIDTAELLHENKVYTVLTAAVAEAIRMVRAAKYEDGHARIPAGSAHVPLYEVGRPDPTTEELYKIYGIETMGITVGGVLYTVVASHAETAHRLICGGGVSVQGPPPAPPPPPPPRLLTASLLAPPATPAPPPPPLPEGYLAASSGAEAGPAPEPSGGDEGGPAAPPPPAAAAPPRRGKAKASALIERAGQTLVACDVSAAHLSRQYAAPPSPLVAAVVRLYGRRFVRVLDAGGAPRWVLDPWPHRAPDGGRNPPAAGTLSAALHESGLYAD